MVSTIAVRRRLPAPRSVGLSALLFPAHGHEHDGGRDGDRRTAKDLSLTLNAPTVAGELAIARAAAAVSRPAGSKRAWPAAADEPPRLVLDTFHEAGAGAAVRGEGAGFLVLEPLDAARARGARNRGRDRRRSVACAPARPHGVGRATRSPALAAALAQAGAGPADIGLVYSSANGDGPRDEWERALLDRALGQHRPRAAR